MGRFIDHANKLMARGADPFRTRKGDLAIYQTITTAGWKTPNVILMMVLTLTVGMIIGAVGLGASAAISDLRFANPRQTVVLDKTRNFEAVIVGMNRAELAERLTAPIRVVEFTANLLRMSAVPAAVSPPDWAMRLGVSSTGVAVDLNESRLEALDFVVTILSRSSREQWPEMFDAWSKFVAVGQDPEASKILWAIANMPPDRRQALYKSGIPLVPDNQDARAIFDKLPTATSRGLFACWRALNEKSR